MPAYEEQHDLAAIVKDLRARLEKLERNNAVQQGTVDTSPLVSTDVENGFQLVDAVTGVVLARFGSRTDLPRLDGSPQPISILRRTDGTTALQVFNESSLIHNQQRLELQDRFGNVIFTEGAEGLGLGAPSIHFPFYKIDVVSTTSAAYQDVYQGSPSINCKYLTFQFDPASLVLGGDIDLRVTGPNSSPVYGTKTITGATVLPVYLQCDMSDIFDPFYNDVNGYGHTVNMTVQMRRSGGAGTVSVRLVAVYGSSEAI